MFTLVVRKGFLNGAEAKSLVPYKKVIFFSLVCNIGAWHCIELN